MSRVFTIDFSFESSVSKAMVCLYEKGYNILVKVQVFNEELHQILPAGKLEFSLTECMRSPSALTHEKGQELVHCIAEKISHYLSPEGVRSDAEMLSYKPA